MLDGYGLNFNVRKEPLITVFLFTCSDYTSQTKRGKKLGENTAKIGTCMDLLYDL